MCLASVSVGNCLASVILLQVLGCLIWWAWRSLLRATFEERDDDLPGVWHYDPRHGQYLPGDHWHQTRGPDHES